MRSLFEVILGLAFIGAGLFRIPIGPYFYLGLMVLGAGIMIKALARND